MPKSLSTGTSKIVPVKMPDDQIEAVKSVLKQGETVSGFMRDAAKQMVNERKTGEIKMHFLFTTQTKVTKAAAKRINKAIMEIDDSAQFVGPLSIPGNRTTGWIERPNDGTNDYNHVRARNEQMAEIARKELGIDG